MNVKSVNGQLKAARPFSIEALIILCLSLIIFFIQFADTCVKSRVWARIINIFGVLSMTCAMLIITKYHDVMIIISSVFGIFVVVGIIKELYTSNMRFYKISGVACVLLLGVNNYIYYTGSFIEILPLLQKITFLTVLLWVAGLNVNLIEIKEELTHTA